MTTKASKAESMFDKFSSRITVFTGNPITFIVACLLILAWGISGPLFGFSDTWQLIINTTTTIITFLMVFIIQQTQNKDTMAMHLKLNELLAANKEASNRLVDVEDLTESELKALKSFYIKLGKMAKRDVNLHGSHSLDEATALHEEKLKSEPKSARKRPSKRRPGTGTRKEE